LRCRALVGGEINIGPKDSITNAYIAIIAMVSVATFGIDPTHKHLILIQRIKRAEKDESDIFVIIVEAAI